MTADFSEDGKSIEFGTWQDAGIGRFSTGGSRIKWQDGESRLLYALKMGRRGNLRLVVGQPNRVMAGARVELVGPDLETIWSRDLDHYNISADLDDANGYVAVGYQRVISHKEEVMKENRIALYSRDGALLWEKGGIFGKWSLLRICDSGYVLVNDASSIYMLNQEGKIMLRRNLPGSVRIFASSASADRVALSTSDGTLSLFSVR
jgi:hypothetical protein